MHNWRKKKVLAQKNGKMMFLSCKRDGVRRGGTSNCINVDGALCCKILYLVFYSHPRKKICMVAVDQGGSAGTPVFAGGLAFRIFCKNL